MNKLLIGFILFILGQALIWIQTNGQFIWKWARDHPLYMALIFSLPIYFIFIGYISLSKKVFTTNICPTLAF